MEYKEDELLLLSGLQHFVFCKRRWGLVFLENQWQDNVTTVEGNIIHEKCHNDGITEHRGDIFLIRGLNVISHILGVIGKCDVVEFHKRQDDKGGHLFQHEGSFDICPIEYKRGAAENLEAYSAQLCGQALCLEEMFGCHIEKGYLYLADKKRREEIIFDGELRGVVKNMLTDMHKYYQKSLTPMGRTDKKCRKCSLQNVCLPKLGKHISVEEYYRQRIEASE